MQLVSLSKMTPDGAHHTSSPKTMQETAPVARAIDRRVEHGYARRHPAMVSAEAHGAPEPPASG
jgi:hypothetical protein